MKVMPSFEPQQRAPAKPVVLAPRAKRRLPLMPVVADSRLFHAL